MRSNQQPAEPQEDFLTSLAMAPVRGVAGAAAGVVNLFGADVEDNFGLGHSQGFVPGFVEGATQFLTGFIPGAGVLSKLGTFSKLGKYASLAKNVAAGAFADFAVFDGNDPRLSNLIQSVPSLQNPLTEFLAADENDSEVFGRLKNVVEGAGLGAITDGVLHAFKAVKKLNRAVSSGDEAAAKAAHEELQSISEEALSGPRNDLEVEAENMLDPAKQNEPRLEEIGREEPALPQDPVKTPQQAESITPAMARERVGYDPRDGDVVVINTNDTSGVLRGFSQWDSIAREPFSRMEILQLKGDARVLRANSTEARKLLGPNSKKLPADVREKEILAAAEANGYDAVRFKSGLKAETVILNKDSVARSINVDSNKPFWPEHEMGKSVADPALVAKSPLETAFKHMDLSPENMDQVVSLMDQARKSETPEEEIKKITGILNLGKLGDRQTVAMARAITDHLGVQPKAKETWESMIDKAAPQLAKFLGRDPMVLAKSLMVDAGNVQTAAQRMLAAVPFVEQHLKAIHGLGQDILNGRTVTDAAGNPLTKEAAIEMFQRQVSTYYTVASMYDRVGTSLGQGLNSMKIGMDRLSQNERMRSLQARGGAKASLKNIQEFLQAYDYSPDHASRLVMGATKKDRIYAAANDWFMFSLLSAPKTATTNIVGTALTSMFKPLENWYGSWVGKKLMAPGMAQSLEREMSTNLRQFNLLRQNFVDLALYAKKAGPNNGQALDAAKQAFASGDSVLLPKSSPLDNGVKQGISAENIGAITGKTLDPKQGFGKFVETWGKITSFPGRFMAASDEFFKQTAAQSYLKSELIQQANEHGLTGAAADQWVEGELSTFFRQGQLVNEDLLRREAEQIYTPERFADESVRQDHIAQHVMNGLSDAPAGRAGEASQYPVVGRANLATQAGKLAQDVTFTTPLDPKRGLLPKAGNLLMQFTNDHPLLKMAFFPFIRTPLNILQFALDRTPLSKDVLSVGQYLLGAKMRLPVGLSEATNTFAQALLRGDSVKIADMTGKFTTAAGAMFSLTAAAQSGVITGRGPEDPEQAKVLKETGWQPYSIKVGDTYVSYQRLDPFASVLSFYGDYADIARYSGPEVDLTDMTTGILMATLTNIQSKSYMSGLVDLIDMIHDPVKKVPDVIGRVAGSFAVPNVIAATRSFTDPHIPELNGMLDQIRSRIPFLAGGMDKQRNVLGEALNKKTYGSVLRTVDGLAGYMLPIQTNTTSSDIVTQELSDLAFPFSQPDPIRLGLDLRDHKNEKGQSAYDRWQELTGTTEIGGRTLRSSLERLIKSNRYQALAHDGLERLDLDSPRVVLIKNLIGRYRRAAERQMLSEFEDVRLLTKEQRQARLALKAGENPQDITALLGR